MDCFICGKILNIEDHILLDRVSQFNDVDGFKGFLIEAYNSKTFLTKCTSCDRDSKLSLLGVSKSIRFDRLKEFCLKTSRSGLMSKNKLKITALWMTLLITGIILFLCASPLNRLFIALYNITLSMMWTIDIISIYLIWKIYSK